MKMNISGKCSDGETVQRETTPLQNHGVVWVGRDIKPTLFMAGTAPPGQEFLQVPPKETKEGWGLTFLFQPPNFLPRQGEIPQVHCRIPYMLHWQEHFCTSGISIFILRSLIITQSEQWQLIESCHVQHSIYIPGNLSGIGNPETADNA